MVKKKLKTEHSPEERDPATREAEQAPATWDAIYKLQNEVSELRTFKARAEKALKSSSETQGDFARSLSFLEKHLGVSYDQRSSLNTSVTSEGPQAAADPAASSSQSSKNTSGTSEGLQAAAAPPALSSQSSKNTAGTSEGPKAASAGSSPKAFVSKAAAAGSGPKAAGRYASTEAPTASSLQSSNAASVNTEQIEDARAKERADTVQSFLYPDRPANRPDARAAACKASAKRREERESAPRPKCRPPSVPKPRPASAEQNRDKGHPRSQWDQKWYRDGGTDQSWNRGGGTEWSWDQTDQSWNWGGGTDQSWNRGGGTAQSWNRDGGTDQSWNRGGGTDQSWNRDGGTDQSWNQSGSARSGRGW